MSTPTLTTSLETVGLSKSFGGVKAVDGADVSFKPGKINALIGPNGSGKTTFFNCVTGMIKPDSGSVSYAGKDITGIPPHRVTRAGIGRSFQLCRIFSRMTVLDNVLVAARTKGLRDALASSRNVGEMDRARGWLARVGIDHLEGIEAGNLSYGQQKLLELAGVLMAEPELIMLDEPAGGVNPALIGRIGTLVRELNAEGRTFLIVEHNMDMVMSLSDHVVVFDRGRPDRRGPTLDGPGRPTSSGGVPRCLTTCLSSTTSKPATAARPSCCATSPSRCPPERSCALSAPTVPASPRSSRSPAACCRPGRARSSSTVSTSPAADRRTCSTPGSPTCFRATASSVR